MVILQLLHQLFLDTKNIKNGKINFSHFLFIKRDEMTILDEDNNFMIELFDSRLDKINILTSMVNIIG